MRSASALTLGDDLTSFFDWATGALLLAGLRERVAAYRRAS